MPNKMNNRLSTRRNTRGLIVLSLALAASLCSGAALFEDSSSGPDRDDPILKRIRGEMLYGSDDYFGADTDLYYADRVTPSPVKAAPTLPVKSGETTTAPIRVTTQSKPSNTGNDPGTGVGTDDGSAPGGDTPGDSGGETPGDGGGTVDPPGGGDEPPPPPPPPPPPDDCPD